MTVPIWQALIPLVLGGLIAALPKILTVRSQNRQTDAATLASSYAVIIDQLKEQVGWQGGEIVALRDQVTSLTGLIGSRDAEVNRLHASLATALAENAQLRTQVDQLTAQVQRLPKRRDDPPPPPLAAA